MSDAGVTLDVHDLAKNYRMPGGATVRGLDGVCLAAAAGSLKAVQGRSGSGKSTLLHILGAMDRPDAGQALVDGVDLWRMSERERVEYRSRVGFVFQRFHLLPALTAWENVAVPLMPRRTKFDKQKRAKELLEQVELSARAGAVPAELSGGEQQRVAIARALIVEPRLVLADEPTGNLDSATGATVLDLILSVLRLHGATLVIATHDDLVTERCEEVVHVEDGKSLCAERTGQVG